MKLPASVVKHLVKYYLETAELSDVKEIRMDHLIKDVNEAWMDQKGESLPSMHPPCYVESNLMLPHISGDSLYSKPFCPAFSMVSHGCRGLAMKTRLSCRMLVRARDAWCQPGA